MSDVEKVGLMDAIESTVDRILNNQVSTAFPATISNARPSEINPNTYVCDVVSAFLTVNDNVAVPVTTPKQILNVPIVLPGRTNTFMIRPPMDPLSLTGASVLLIVSDTYLANWKKTGGAVLPRYTRRFNCADAIAILGYYPDINSWPTPPKVNTAQVKVQDGTFIEIGNNTADLLRMMQDLIFIMNQPNTGGNTPVPATVGPNGDTMATLITKIATLANPDPTP